MAAIHPEKVSAIVLRSQCRAVWLECTDSGIFSRETRTSDVDVPMQGLRWTLEKTFAGFLSIDNAGIGEVYFIVNLSSAWKIIASDPEFRNCVRAALVISSDHFSQKKRGFDLEDECLQFRVKLRAESLGKIVLSVNCAISSHSSRSGGVARN